MEDQNDTSTPSTLGVTLFSFGFKHGVPVDATFLFDVRFLPNPYWEEHLRHQSGREKEISEFVVGSEPGTRFRSLFEPLLVFVAEQLQEGGKKTARIGIGCTGGRHRSVAVVEALAETLRKNPLLNVDVFHRDIERSASPTGTEFFSRI